MPPDIRQWQARGGNYTADDPDAARIAGAIEQRLAERTAPLRRGDRDVAVAEMQFLINYRRHNPTALPPNASPAQVRAHEALSRDRELAIDGMFGGRSARNPRRIVNETGRQLALLQAAMGLQLPPASRGVATRETLQALRSRPDDEAAPVTRVLPAARALTGNHVNVVGTEATRIATAARGQPDAAVPPGELGARLSATHGTPQFDQAVRKITDAIYANPQNRGAVLHSMLSALGPEHARHTGAIMDALVARAGERRNPQDWTPETLRDFGRRVAHPDSAHILRQLPGPLAQELADRVLGRPVEGQTIPPASADEQRLGARLQQQAILGHTGTGREGDPPGVGYRVTGDENDLATLRQHLRFAFNQTGGTADVSDPARQHVSDPDRAAMQQRLIAWLGTQATTNKDALKDIVGSLPPGADGVAALRTSYGLPPPDPHAGVRPRVDALLRFPAEQRGAEILKALQDRTMSAEDRQALMSALHALPAERLSPHAFGETGVHARMNPTFANTLEPNFRARADENLQHARESTQRTLALAMREVTRDGNVDPSRITQMLEAARAAGIPPTAQQAVTDALRDRVRRQGNLLSGATLAPIVGHFLGDSTTPVDQRATRINSLLEGMTTGRADVEQEIINQLHTQANAASRFSGAATSPAIAQLARKLGETNPELAARIHRHELLNLTTRSQGEYLKDLRDNELRQLLDNHAAAGPQAAELKRYLETDIRRRLREASGLAGDDAWNLLQNGARAPSANQLQGLRQAYARHPELFSNSQLTNLHNALPPGEEKNKLRDRLRELRVPGFEAAALPTAPVDTPATRLAGYRTALEGNGALPANPELVRDLFAPDRAARLDAAGRQELIQRYMQRIAGLGDQAEQRRRLDEIKAAMGNDEAWNRTLAGLPDPLKRLYAPANAGVLADVDRELAQLGLGAPTHTDATAIQARGQALVEKLRSQSVTLEAADFDLGFGAAGAQLDQQVRRTIMQELIVLAHEDTQNRAAILAQIARALGTPRDPARLQEIQPWLTQYRLTLPPVVAART